MQEIPNVNASVEIVERMALSAIASANVARGRSNEIGVTSTLPKTGSDGTAHGGAESHDGMRISKRPGSQPENNFKNL
jgi:hypothetical protein